MTKPIVSILFICALFSCHQQPAHNKQPIDVTGDWIGPIDTLTHRNSQTSYVSFEGSLCSGSLPDTFMYHIQTDTLYLQAITGDKTGRTIQFGIRQWTPDSLTLLAAKHIDYVPDTMVLSKVKAKNNITPSAIYFASSGCFGSCPIVSVEIDSSLNISLYGTFTFPDAEKGYKGTITRADYNALIDKIKTLPVQTLQPAYRAPWTDDQTRAIALQVGDSVIQSAAYGHYKEPMELYLLFNKVESIYINARLHRDSTVNAHYFETHPAKSPINEVLTLPYTKR